MFFLNCDIFSFERENNIEIIIIYSVVCYFHLLLYLSQVMIPYQHGLIRCHPSWTQIQNKSKLKEDTRITSTIHVDCVCSCCAQIFNKKINNITQSTGRCRRCSVQLINMRGYGYVGNIPRTERTIIRAGILHCLENDNIIDILQEQGEDGRFSNEQYVNWIQDIRQYKTDELLNNRFWDRNDIPWMNKRKRESEDGSSTMSEQYTINQEEHNSNERGKIDSPNTFQLRTQKTKKQYVKTNDCYSSFSIFRNALRLEYWLPDYAYWAPVVRMARHNMDCMVELWLGYIHPRLFLPTEFFIVPMKAVDEDYKWQCAIRLLYSLSICLSMFYEVPTTEARGERAVKFDLFYSTLFVRLRSESVDFCLHHMKHSKSIIHMLLWTSSYFGQIIDWSIVTTCSWTHVCNFVFCVSIQILLYFNSYSHYLLRSSMSFIIPRAAIDTVQAIRDQEIPMNGKMQILLQMRPSDSIIVTNNYTI